MFEGCDGTIRFTKRVNDLFDSLNRSYPAEGIRINGKDFEVSANAQIHFLLFF